jgi:hypothetical protein
MSHFALIHNIIFLIAEINDEETNENLDSDSKDPEDQEEPISPEQTQFEYLPVVSNQIVKDPDEFTLKTLPYLSDIIICYSTSRGKI